MWRLGSATTAAAAAASKHTLNLQMMKRVGFGGAMRGARSAAVSVAPRPLRALPLPLLHHSAALPLLSCVAAPAAHALSIPRAFSSSAQHSGAGCEAARNDASSSPPASAAEAEAAGASSPLRRWLLHASQRVRSRALPPIGAAPCVAAASAGASTTAEPAAPSAASAASSASSESPLTPAETEALTDALQDQLSGLNHMPADLVSAPHWIVQQSIDVLHWVHDTSATPWWLTLVLCALGARVLLLPVQLFATRVTAGIMTLSGHFALFDTVLRRSPGTPRQKMAQSAKFKLGLYNRFHCNPLYLIPGVGLQVSLFILIGLSLRRMLLTTPSLATGGLAWFPDLGVPDPYYILPGLTWALSYGVSWYVARDREMQEQHIKQESGVERIQAEMMRAGKSKSKGGAGPTAAASAVSTPEREPTHLELLSHYARGVQVLMICVYPQVASGLLVFWLTSLTWQVLYTRLMATESMRARMGFEGVIPSPQAFVNNVHKMAAIQQSVRDNEARRARHAGSRVGADGSVLDEQQQQHPADEQEEEDEGEWEYEEVSTEVKSPDGSPATLLTLNKQRKRARQAEQRRAQQALMQPKPKQT